MIQKAAAHVTHGGMVGARWSDFLPSYDGPFGESLGIVSTNLHWVWAKTGTDLLSWLVVDTRGPEEAPSMCRLFAVIMAVSAAFCPAVDIVIKDIDTLCSESQNPGRQRRQLLSITGVGSGQYETHYPVMLLGTLRNLCSFAP